MNNYDYYYYYDEPVPYIYNENIPDNNILIHPVRVKESLLFYMCIPVLLIQKNRIPDIKVIKMSYLDYIFSLVVEEVKHLDEVENSQTIRQFNTLMQLCLKINANQIDFVTDENNKAILRLINYEHKDGTVKDVFITASMFDDIKKIICEYNMVELPDDTIDPKLEEALEEARKFKTKNDGIMGSLEDQYVCIAISSSYKLEDIYGLTIRKFRKILERIDHKLHYEIYKSAECAGTEFKVPIKHWQSEIIRDKYAGLLVDYDSTVDKLTT
jgi:hypothetical protein